jgi:hypothetical protein
VPILEHVPLGNVVVAEVVDLGEQVGAADLTGNAPVGLVRLETGRESRRSRPLPLFVRRGKGLSFRGVRGGLVLGKGVGV